MRFYACDLYITSSGFSKTSSSMRPTKRCLRRSLMSDFGSQSATTTYQILNLPPTGSNITTWSNVAESASKFVRFPRSSMKKRKLVTNKSNNSIKLFTLIKIPLSTSVSMSSRILMWGLQHRTTSAKPQNYHWTSRLPPSCRRTLKGRQETT